MIDLKQLVAAGVHFGHKKSRWHPKMKPYIWGVRSGTHLINVAKTAHQLEQAAKFLEEIAAQGKTIFWVGTKKQAQPIVAQAATALKSPFVTHRWIGGTFTNFTQVKKSITKLLHLEDVLQKSDPAQSHYTKKELVSLSKVVERLGKNVSSIRGMIWPIGAVVIVDVKKEQTALKEAIAMGIPVVGIVDTNTDPSSVDYVIPANDDAPKSIAFLVDFLAQAVAEGKKRATERPQEQIEAEQNAAVEVSSFSNDEESDASKRQKKGKGVREVAARPRRGGSSGAQGGPRRRA
ncbi:MAG: 30S ribosomal protein S2 [Candidatus Babeliales bacterium]